MLIISIIYILNVIIETFGSSVPTFCINKLFHNLVTRHFVPITSEVIQIEISRLKQTSASEYFRSFDLLAYNYFVLEQNPLRTTCDKAMYEYFPFLPFYWLPPAISPQYNSNVSVLINDILSFVEIDNLSPESGSKRHRFTVASPYNFRTLLGSGITCTLYHVCMNRLQKMLS